MSTSTTTLEEVDKKIVWNSEELLKGLSDVVILHNGKEYHLKKTKNDRLMLQT